jgi:hypothetical protein
VSNDNVEASNCALERRTDFLLQIIYVVVSFIDFEQPRRVGLDVRGKFVEIVGNK